VLPLWGIVLGVVVGLLRRGKLSNLAHIPLKGLWLVFAGLALQLLIFPTPWWPEPPVRVATEVWHVSSYALVVAFFLWNWRVASLWLIALGMALNLSAIAANGGYMPANVSALRAAGRAGAVEALLTSPDHTYANVVRMSESTRLNVLGDWLYLPNEVPLANAFSLGDLILLLGGAWLIQGGMAARPEDAARRPS